MKRQFKLEKTRPFISVIVAILIGFLALVLIDFLFAGMAPFLGFILASIAIYIYFRR